MVNERHSATFKLDTGADANVITQQLYMKVSDRPLNHTNTTLSAFGDTKIMPLGKIDLRIKSKKQDKSQIFTFYVTDASNVCILGSQACENLNLVKRVDVHQLSSGSLNAQSLQKEYQDVFTGTGAYSKKYHIEVDSTVPPVIQYGRKVPYASYDKLKNTLDRLEEEGIIASVDKPTDWVHNLVITEKRNGSLRVCLDPKPLNKAIKRERYDIPTAADVQGRLAGKKVFTVIDMKDGYWHVCLTEESSYLCTFHTPWGRKRFLRMPFGICSASEVMQKRNEETFGDIPGVNIIADDMIIAADNDVEHDIIVHKVMQRAREMNVRFNKDKTQFKVAEVGYMGHIVSSEGLRADPAKVEAIAHMPRPENKQDMLRILGMVRYLAQYIPYESTITAPLRALLKQDAMWKWEHEHEEALEQIKTALQRDVKLQFYDVNKDVAIQTDASQSGLGSCLMQGGRPIAYASRSLTSAERNYSQIEKEMLAICFACEKFYQYIYGKSVEVQTDHRPMEAIHKKPIARAPPRLQRMMLQLQRYNHIVKFVPGKFMYVADTLSRAYLPGKSTCGAPDDIEVMVHSLVRDLPVSADALEEFRRETTDDDEFKLLQKAITQGWPRKKTGLPPRIQLYWNVRDEMHETDGLLFRGDRLLVPSKLRPKMLALLHESHLGAEKCKSRARAILYWPNMSTDIEEVVAHCATCLKFRANNQKEPLIPHSVPDGPWQKVAADIMTFKGHDYIVVVDYYSKYPEMARLDRKTATSVIVHMKSIFARHGIPEEIVSEAAR